MTCANVPYGCRGYSDKVGVLLAQLGTPDAPTRAALRRYLKQFLSDRRVIEVNRVLWWVLLNGIILNTRPKRSAALYARIWGHDGSPLLTITRSQTDKLRARLHRIDPRIEVMYGMRYGQPSLEKAIDELAAKGVTQLILVPMYPQYAAPTTASVYDMVFPHLLKRRWVPTLKVVAPFFQHPSYVRALTTTIEEGYKNLGYTPERLILSYHGVPQKYVKKGDPYCCQCVETTRLFKAHTSLPTDSVIHTFQSRFGSDPWLQPYTDDTIEELAKAGVKDLAVACPGFVADCLETLDEIGNEALEAFHEHGGERLKLIPGVNDHETFIDCLETVVRETAGPWIEPRALSVIEGGAPGTTCACPSACNE
jgi:ferrochelatase